MLAFFAKIFGVVLKLLYNLVGNYGWAIILFSILVKVIMIPISIKQQKAMKKNQKIQEEMKTIQFKYKNDPEKLNQEVMALYKREGASPFSGCLSSIVQIILLFSVFLLVRQPLTYMVRIDPEPLSKMEAIVQEQNSDSRNAYMEISLIQYVKNINTETSVVEKDGVNILDYKDKINLNMDFLGIDLSQIPTQNWKDVRTLIIPILYVISSFISIKLSSSMTNQKQEKKLITDGQQKEGEEKNYNPMDDASKTMVWMMPIMSVSIAAIAPLGLALYWLMNNILMIIERLVLNKILNKEEEAEDNA